MSEGTTTFNAQEEIERLKRMFDDAEQALELGQQRMAALANMVFEMDGFLKSMLQNGHFDETINKLQSAQSVTPPIIIPGA